MSRVLLAASSGLGAGRSGLVLILLAAVLWGTVGVATRAVFSLAETTALTVAFLRLGLSLPVLGGASIAVLGISGFKASPRHLLLMSVSGLMLAGYQLCFFGALQRV